MSAFKDYLGDSVYADFDGHGIVLTTENGYPDDPRNKIFLEPEVYAALLRYAERIKNIQREATEKESNALQEKAKQ